MQNQGFSKIWLFIILILLVAVAAVFIWQLQQPTEKETETVPTEEISEEALEVKIEKDKIDEAVSYCDKIVSEKSRSACVKVVKGKEGACESLESTKKTSCYISLARRKGDPSICKKIDNEQKYYCLALLTGNHEYCEKTWTSFKEYCYENVALITGKPSICKHISKSKDSDSCLAVVKEEPQLCSQRNCIVRLALFTGDSTICERIKELPANVEMEDEEVKEFQLTQAQRSCRAEAKKNVSDLDCAGNDRGLCETIATFTENGSICGKLEHPRFETIGDPCYFDTAMNLLGVYPQKIPQGW